MELDRQKDLRDDRMSDGWSFGSNYHPCSQPRKTSIGVIDTSAITRSGATKEDKAALPNSGKVASSGGKSIKDKDEGSGVIAAMKGKQSEAPKQETSPWISIRSINQETPATETVQFNANRASSLQTSGGMQNKFDREKEAPATKSVQFYANRTSILQSGNGMQKKFDSMAYEKMREKGGTTKRVEEFAFATAHEVSTLDKREREVRTEKTAYRSNEALRVKLWGILGTNPSPKERNSNSQTLEVSEKNLKPAGNLDSNGSNAGKPGQNSDTIETDSESPADQTVRRIVTRSLSRKKAPTTVQLKLHCKINNRGNLSSSTSYRRKRQEKNSFSFAEVEGWSGSLHGIVNDGSSMSKRKKGERKSSKNEQHRICSPEKDNEDKIWRVTDKSKSPPPAEKTSSHCNEIGGFQCHPPQNNRAYLQPKNGMLEKDFHHSPITTKKTDQQEDFDSPPLPENANQQERMGSLSLRKNADPQNDFQSPTFAMKTPIRSSSPSPPSPKRNSIEHDAYSPARAHRRFTVESFSSLWTLRTLKPGSLGLDAQTKSFDDTGGFKESPIGESSPVMEEKYAENRLSQSSSVEKDAESAEEDFHINKGFRETETWSPETSSPEKPPVMLRPSKRLRSQEGIKITELSPTSSSLKGSEESGGFQGPSDQNQEDGLARAVALFALGLERFKTKMKSQTCQKSSDILASVAEGIQLQLQNVESQIQTDIGKLTGLGKSKKKHLEMRFQEQQERLKLIHEKFKEEVNQHLQDCRSTLEELEAYQIELKGTAERQKALHRKHLLQVEEVIETQLGDAERRITAVQQVAREKMLQLKHVITECLKEGIFS